MSHSFSQNHIHLIFSTKDRANSIPKEFLSRMWAYLGSICDNHRIAVLAAGGTENHVHLLFHLPPKISLADAVNLLKVNSSKWMSEQGPPFRWQEGYGAFSVSFSGLDATVQYIRVQEAHHRKISFEDEFRAILEKHRVTYDPNYLLRMIRFVPPLWGSNALTHAVPPLPRWATIVRPTGAGPCPHGVMPTILQRLPS